MASTPPVFGSITMIEPPSAPVVAMRDSSSPSTIRWM
jgi:hypothetical protein